MTVSDSPQISAHDQKDRETFWRELIDCYGPRLRGYCLSFPCTRADVEDIVWDVWQEAVAHEAMLRAHPDTAWSILESLIRVACRWRVRLWRKERYVGDAALARMVGAEISEQVDTPHTPVLVGDLVLNLPYKQRLAVDFRYRWNWPYWAIAAALDCSETAVRVNVSRGLRQLRQTALGQIQRMKQSPDVTKHG